MTVLRMCKCGLFVSIRRQVLLEEPNCWICGRPGTQTDPLTADHVTPRSKGGTNVRQNYRAAHASCNYSRGAA